MIRIRCILSAALARGRDSVAQAQELFRRTYPAESAYAAKIPDLLDRPFRHHFRAALLLSESARGKVTGFSLVLHFPEVNSSLLDFLVVDPEGRGAGVGAALYEATREYGRRIGSRGLYMEVLSDAPALNPDAGTLADNRRRMRFYESFGVRPIIGTDYEEPVDRPVGPPPSLLFDGLGRPGPLRRAEARAAVRLILQRKYSHIVGPDYIKRVVESFVDDPIRFRPARHGGQVPEASQQVAVGRLEQAFAVICTDRQEIHHVADRGYVERPARVEAIRQAVEGTGLFTQIAPRHFGEAAILAVHDRDFVSYLRRVCQHLTSRQPVYPYVFPIRRQDRPPRELAVRAGYYCIDTFTPLDRNAYLAARASVDAALTASEELLRGRPVVYAVCRPPGHHAGRRTFGGFCYFNNAAIAAQRLCAEGKTAVLDIDYHHGNGTQEIFYERSDVLTIPLHGHPNTAYPYFSGFADEKGAGAGAGCNRNFPLADGCGEGPYLKAMDEAGRLIVRFDPACLVVCLGLDTLRGDPTGSFGLAPGTLRKVGAALAALGKPTLVVQEGGYSLRNLRRGGQAFFLGMADGLARRVGRGRA